MPVIHTFLDLCKSNILWNCFFSELHENKCYPNYTDICQTASADELFEAYQCTSDPDLFQVRPICAVFGRTLLFCVRSSSNKNMDCVTHCQLKSSQLLYSCVKMAF